MPHAIAWMTHPAHSLVEVFQAHLPAGTLPPEGRAALEERLGRAVAAARAPWPDLGLSAVQFIRHVAERFPAEEGTQPVEAVLESLHLSDLYLACACANGAPAAIAILEHEYLSKVPAVLRYRRLSSDTIDDVCQKLREKLLLQTASAPAIATYTGEGRLQVWI